MYVSSEGSEETVHFLDCAVSVKLSQADSFTGKLVLSTTTNPAPSSHKINTVL